MSSSGVEEFKKKASWGRSGNEDFRYPAVYKTAKSPGFFLKFENFPS